MYVCGIIIYDYCYIGYVCIFVGFDVIVCYFCYIGYDLKYVCNIIDVDDKIIKCVNENGEFINDLMICMIKVMYEDFDSLNMLCFDVELIVINYMDEIIVMVECLIVKGYVYIVVDGDVLFDVFIFE